MPLPWPHAQTAAQNTLLNFICTRGCATERLIANVGKIEYLEGLPGLKDADQVIGLLHRNNDACLHWMQPALRDTTLWRSAVGLL
jgi:hypothetical protein